MHPLGLGFGGGGFVACFEFWGVLGFGLGFGGVLGLGLSFAGVLGCRV